MAGQTYTGLQHLQKIPNKNTFRKCNPLPTNNSTQHISGSKNALVHCTICLTHSCNSSPRKTEYLISTSARPTAALLLCYGVHEVWILSNPAAGIRSHSKNLPSSENYKYKYGLVQMPRKMNLPTATPTQSSDTSSLLARLLTSHVLASMMPAERWSQVPVRAGCPSPFCMLRCRE